MGLVTAVRQRLTFSRRGVVAIVGGTAGGQLVALSASPVLTRLYTPEDFGVFTVLSSMALTFGAVAALRFDLAVPLPDREKDALSLAYLGLMAACFSGLVGTLVVTVADEAIVAIFEQPKLGPWLWLVPLTASVVGGYLVLNQLAIRHRRYGAIGRRSLVQSLTMVTAQIAFGAAGLRSGGLFVGLGVGQLTGAVSLLRGSGLTGAVAKLARERGQIRYNASRYRRFPLLLAPAGLINVLGMQLPVLFIASWYGSEVAGWLGLTQRILLLPVTLIGMAIGQVYLAELSRAVRDDPERARMLFVRASRTLATVAALVVIVICAGGPPVFSWVFGSQWRTSGVYAQALSLGFAAQFLASPLSRTLIVFERQVTQLLWDVARLVVVSGTVVTSAWLGASPLATMWAFSVSSTLAYLSSWIISWNTIFSSDPSKRGDCKRD